MIRLLRIPDPPLSEFVELLWLWEGYSQPHTFERLLPTGTQVLVVNLLEDRSRVYDRERLDRYETMRGAVVAGAYSEYSILDTAEQQATLGVQFRPGGAFPFFGLPADELQDRTVSLEDLWGAEAVCLRDRILAAATPEERCRILEGALLARARSLARHPAVAFAVRELRRQRTVASVLEQVGFSQRHFIQLFRRQVGLTPKLYCRVQRFQAVLHRLQGIGSEVDWAEVALSCGYFDQAHFIRDFRSFSGLTPSAYLAQRTGHLNHVPLAV